MKSFYVIMRDGDAWITPQPFHYRGATVLFGFRNGPHSRKECEQFLESITPEQRDAERAFYAMNLRWEFCNPCWIWRVVPANALYHFICVCTADGKNPWCPVYHQNLLELRKTG